MEARSEIQAQSSFEIRSGIAPLCFETNERQSRSSKGIIKKGISLLSLGRIVGFVV
jgi:hypothetical protein